MDVSENFINNTNSKILSLVNETMNNIFHSFVPSKYAKLSLIGNYLQEGIIFQISESSNVNWENSISLKNFLFFIFFNLIFYFLFFRKLSGGQRSLLSISFLFSLSKFNSSFFILGKINKLKKK